MRPPYLTETSLPYTRASSFFSVRVPSTLSWLVTVNTYYELSEASVARSFLDAHGVIAWFPEGHHASVAWHNIHALSGIRLVTLGEMAEEARALLEAHSEPEPQPPPMEPRSTWRRPEITVADLIIAVFFLAHSGLPFPLWRRRHRIA